MTELKAFEVWMGRPGGEKPCGAKSDKAMSAPCKEHLGEGTMPQVLHRVLGYYGQGTRVLSHICRAHSFYGECSEGGSICEAHLRFVIRLSLRTANPLSLLTPEELLTPSSSCIQATCTGGYEGVRITLVRFPNHYFW